MPSNEPPAVQSRRATLVYMLALASTFAAIGILADMVAAPDGAMLILWFLGGAFYYQMMRHPKVVVATVRAVWPAQVSVAELPPSKASRR